MKAYLEKLENIAGLCLLAVITVLVFMAAVMRFFGHPLIWSVDLAQLLFIWLCFFAATRAMRQRLHLGVDFAVALLSRQHRLYIETALTVVFIAFLAVLAREGYNLTLLNKERLFGDSGLSYAWVTVAVPVGSILLSLAILSNLIESWRKNDLDAPLIYTRIRTGDTDMGR